MYIINKTYKTKINLTNLSVTIKYLIDCEWLNNLKDVHEIPTDVALNITNLVCNNNMELSKKDFKKYFKKLFYSLTILNEKYWTDRGWTQLEAQEKIKEHQTKRSLISVKKNIELKNTDYKSWAKRKNVTLEYYINKGFSETEAKEELKKRQSTFSQEKCTKKYGEKEGNIIFFNRQIKWQTSLENKSTNEIDEINKKKDSNTIAFYKLKYGDDWIKEFLNGISSYSLHNEFINEAIITCNNIEDFICFVKSNNEFLTVTNLYWIFNSKVIQEFYNLDFHQLKEKILKAYGNKKTSGYYGYNRLYDGHICRSTGEYLITKFLVENNIEYIYEENYPNQTVTFPQGLRYDFYLPKFNLYLEYSGMLYKKKNENYSKRLKQKSDHCEKYNLNYFFSENYKIIIEKIKTLIK